MIVLAWAVRFDAMLVYAATEAHRASSGWSGCARGTVILPPGPEVAVGRVGLTDRRTCSQQGRAHGPLTCCGECPIQ